MHFEVSAQFLQLFDILWSFPSLSVHLGYESQIAIAFASRTLSRLSQPVSGVWLGRLFIPQELFCHKADDMSVV